jgi:hypothetical protein
MGGGDQKVRNRYHSEEDELEIEGLVPQTGPSFLGKRHHYCEVSIQPYAPDAEVFSGIGVIEEAEYEGAQGDAQSETVTIGLNPDYAV